MAHLSPRALADWFSQIYGGLPEGIIFDCDGVIIDSREANIQYYNYLRRYLGLPPIAKDLEDFVQAGTVKEVLDVIIPKPLRPFVREASRKVSYVNDIMPHMKAYPGLHGVLDFCRDAGIRMGIDTNRIDGMDVILDNCRLHGYFDPIILADGVPNPKPAPDGALHIARTWGLATKRLLFIGDSSSDLGAAEKAGIPFLSFQTEGLAEHSVADFASLRESLLSLHL